MAAKYYVWGEGVWRELDMASGRVVGWRRRARFVFVRRDRLQLARHRPVLRALQALATGAPGAAADGPRLLHRSKTELRTKLSHRAPAVAPEAPATPAAPAACEHQHHCCTHNRCVDIGNQHLAPCGPSAAHGSLPKRDVASQCQLPRNGFTINVPSTSAAATSAPAAVAGATSLRTKANGLEVLLERHAPVSEPPAASSEESTHTEDTRHVRARRPNKRARVVSSDNTESSGPEQACKELLVSDADVAAVREYVRMRHPEAVKRFDEDESYKRQLFYSINPLVELERCARLERLLSQRSAAALPHFAARLGLAPSAHGARRRRGRSTSADTDKENKDKYSSQQTKTDAASEPVGGRVSRRGVSERNNKQKQDDMRIAPEADGDARVERPAKAMRRSAEEKQAGAGDAARALPGTHVISQRASQANAKVYSNLEDHAIVAWVSSGARATLVSGNRVWRDLQEQFERLTGRGRSWHSLRNRYLRYILPALGALHLPPAEVSRLRAAAATGVMKAKQQRAGAPAKRHSMFAEPARGASSRRPRSGASDQRHNTDDHTDDPSPPKRRSLRIQPQEAGDRDAGGSQSTSKTSGRAATSQASKNKEPHSEGSGNKPGRKARSPRYSEVTRRFAARHPSPGPRSSPRSSSRSSPRSPSPAPPSTRSRRLFNPNAKL